MSQGKYSPNLPSNRDGFHYNSLGNVPDSSKSDLVCDEKLMFPNYDKYGFDSYGYSCYDSHRNYVGMGVDRNGYTEMDYLCMDADDYNDIVRN